MADHPILFNDAMVRAILDGRKTWTRRPVTRSKPPFAIGDTLWVREAWTTDNGAIAFRADYPGDAGLLAWRPSIHMPRRMCRLRLRVQLVLTTGIQHLSELQAAGEGVGPEDGSFVAAFRRLWDSIYGKRYPWASNPRVWAVWFRKVK